MESSSGLPLDQYTKAVPPGWKPNLYWYTFRRFIERLRLWYRVTDLAPESIGPAIAGRLQGRPYNFAMTMAITMRDGTHLTGDAALAYVGEPEHPTGTGGMLPAIESGPQQLVRILQRKFGIHDQDLVGKVIDEFIDLTWQIVSLGVLQRVRVSL